MIKFIQSVFLFCLIVIVAGCASNQDQITRIPPPDDFNPIFLKYKDLPGQKVMTIAVDPTGEWSFGYDFNKDTLEEAAVNAATYCDQSRDKFKVVSKARLFAVNDEIVYYDNVINKK
jgi:hypothetical protein